MNKSVLRSLSAFLYFFSCIFLPSIFFAAVAQAYTVVGYEGEPFYFKNGTAGITGSCHELVAELCARQKLTCKFKVASIPKILEMMKRGEADISCPLAFSEERQEFISYSEKIFRTHYSFFATPDVGKRITKLEDLESYSVSVFAPSIMSETLQKINTDLGEIFTVVHENTEMNSLFKAEKVAKTLGFTNGDIGKHWIQKSKSSLVELPTGQREIYYYVGFSKKSLKAEQALHLTALLETMRREKYLQKLAQKYQLQSDDVLVKNELPKTETPPP